MHVIAYDADDATIVRGVGVECPTCYRRFESDELVALVRDIYRVEWVHAAHLEEEAA